MSADVRLDDEWFGPSSADDADPTILDAIMFRPVGNSARSAVASALAGACGGAIGLAVADGSADLLRLRGHVALVLGHTVANLGVVSVAREWVAACVLGGMLLGGAFGVLTRRLRPVLARMVFGAVSFSALFTLLFAFVLGRYLPWFVHTAPFVPTWAGVLAYSLCVALVPPVRARRMRVFDVVAPEPLPSATSTAEFPLVRRRRVVNA